MKDSLQFGNTEITYDVRWSSERKHLSITVDGAKVQVAVPEGLLVSEVQRRVRGKAAWILQKLDENRMVAKVYPRKLVSGESLHYLGRQYRLRVLFGEEVGVKLWRGELVLSQGEMGLREDERLRLVRDWYRSHLTAKLGNMVAGFALRLGISPPIFYVRELGGRWGSCGKNGVLYFHWQLARLPLTKVEYVCAHEMVHLLEPRHSREFRSLLVRVLPTHQALAGSLSL